MTKGKVLIVDDEPDIVNLIKFILERKGFETIVARDGQTAIDMAIAEKPDLILLDAVMPVVDGYEACRQLKENPATKSIPIVILSAKSQRAEIQMGIQTGAHDYICKPFDPKGFVSGIEEILKELKPVGDK